MEINLWYGNRQQFGSLGNPQRLVNILGTVSQPDDVVWIRYDINEQYPGDLCIGPDQRRLQNPGDFNLEVETNILQDGMNQIEISALSVNGNQAKKILTLDYTSGKSWPLPYNIDWSTTENIQSVAQVIDGLWEIDGDQILCAEPGYDRLLAIGDRESWRNYEITVPITMHAIRPTGMRFPSCGHWAGFVIRWQGHYDWSGDQPLRGWFPLGAICGNIWKGHLNRRVLAMIGNNDQSIHVDESGRQLELGRPYFYKVRVRSQSDGPNCYAMKVWDVEQTEPQAWGYEGLGIEGELDCGSILLGAHQCQASFGKVSVTPLETTS